MLTSCGHTHCLKCLTKIFDRTGRLQRPTCRVNTPISQDCVGAVSLPINFQTIQLLEKSQASKLSREEIAKDSCLYTELVGNGVMVCVNCEGDSPKEGVLGCMDCDAIFYDDCNACTCNLRCIEIILRFHL